VLYRLIIRYIRKLRDIYNQVMDLPDSSKKIAQGVALGITLEFLPLPFISIPISFIVAKLLRFNSIAAVLTVIFFKWAFPFCFYLNYIVGKTLIGEFSPQPVPFDMTPLNGLGAWFGGVRHLGVPFLIGAAINSTAVSIITYFSVKALLDCYRKKKKPRLVKISHPGEIK